jgi:hypothetical protein
MAGFIIAIKSWERFSYLPGFLLFNSCQTPPSILLGLITGISPVHSALLEMSSATLSPFGLAESSLVCA